MFEFYTVILSLFDSGGVVLYPLFLLTFMLWVLLLERYIYFYFYAGKFKKYLIMEYINTKDCFGTYQIYIKNHLIMQYKEALLSNSNLVKVLYALAPLLGLLGTVIGMMEIFDIMAIVGNSSARSLSNGVAMATIPTLCGMVIAIGSILFIKRYENMVQNEILNMFESTKYGTTKNKNRQ